MIDIEYRPGHLSQVLIFKKTNVLCYLLLLLLILFLMKMYVIAFENSI